MNVIRVCRNPSLATRILFWMAVGSEIVAILGDLVATSAISRIDTN